MLFEFDPDKSAINKENHGLDFVEAQQLWNDENRYQISKEYRGEERYAVVGRIGRKIYAAICTDRGERIRIITVRRAHKDEERLYRESIDERR
jgi:uncharacterized DUF497 family protein